MADQNQELRALVVDDEVDGATSLSYLLQVLGCRTAVAYGGQTGLRVAQLFKPGIVFLDLHMPGPDGCDIVAEAKKQGGALAKALFVCFTGQSAPGAEQRCREAGFDRFVTKPMDPAVLQDLLAEAQLRSQAVAEEAQAALRLHGL